MSKIERTDSWASWGGRLWTFIFGNKTFSVGVVMSFASSFLAPIKSTIGLSATVIYITGLGAIIFLLISLLWILFLEKKNSNEIKKEKERFDMEYGNEIRKEMIAISDKKTTGELTFEQSKEMIERRIAAATDEIKIVLLPIMKVFCDGNKSEYSKNEYDKFYLLWKNFQPFQENIMRLLLYKAAPKIATGEISRQAIEFLKSITDNDLEILKKQFKYVLQLPHLDVSKDLVIPRHEEDEKGSKIHNLLLKEGEGLIHLQSYTINFYGDIWLGENFRIVELYSDTLISNIDGRENHDLKITSKKSNSPIKDEIVNPNVMEKKPKVTIPLFVCLSAVGEEIFNLLKDEIEQTPIEYLDVLVAFWNKSIANSNFELLVKTKMVTNDNA